MGESIRKNIQNRPKNFSAFFHVVTKRVNGHAILSPFESLKQFASLEPLERRGVKKEYRIELEIAGHTAMWTRPDTGDAPVSYLAPTFSAAKGIFESVCWLKSAVVRPTRVEICEDPVWHTYTTNYGGPLRKADSVRKGNSFQLLATVLAIRQLGMENLIEVWEVFTNWA